jgi:hypothetical protein
MVKIDVQVLAGMGDQPGNHQRLWRHVQGFLVWWHVAAQKEKCRSMTFQRPANGALCVLAVRHFVPEWFESETKPPTEEAFSLF